MAAIGPAPSSPPFPHHRGNCSRRQDGPGHAHEQEEVWHVLEGELEITIGKETKRAGADFVGIVPPDTLHTVRALTNGKAIVVDYPLREMVSGA
jgi:quercetin dioxygenase-like cupin family protein